MKGLKRFGGFYALLAVVSLAPLTMFAQAQQRPAAPKAPVTLAQAAPDVVSKEMPFSGAGWQDAIIKQEGYVKPPKENADEVLTKPYLNMTVRHRDPGVSGRTGKPPPCLCPWHRSVGIWQFLLLRVARIVERHADQRGQHRHSKLWIE